MTKLPRVSYFKQLTLKYLRLNHQQQTFVSYFNPISSNVLTTLDSSWRDSLLILAMEDPEHARARLEDAISALDRVDGSNGRLFGIPCVERTTTVTIQREALKMIFPSPRIAILIVVFFHDALIGMEDFRAADLRMWTKTLALIRGMVTWRGFFGPPQAALTHLGQP